MKLLRKGKAAAKDWGGERVGRIGESHQIAREKY